MRLPKGALVTVWAPHLNEAATDLADLLRVVELVEPNHEQALLGALGTSPVVELYRTLRDPNHYQARGVDGVGALSLTLSDDGKTWVLGFGISDRPKFLRWLAELDEPKFVSLLGEQVMVLGADTELPVACHSIEQRAHCQIGADQDPAPLASLENVLKVDSTGRTSPALQSAMAALPPQARLYGIFDPTSWVDHLAKRRLDAVRQRNRFEPPSTKKALEENLKDSELRWKRTGKSFNAGALALVRRGSAVELHAELGLTPAGQKALEELAPKQSSRGPVARWAETPALIHGQANVDPRLAAAVLEALEAPPVPIEALDGAMGVLVYGVDCDCDAAKKRVDPKPLDWAFLFPSAIAVGRSDRRMLDSWPEAISEPVASDPSGNPLPRRQVLRTTPNGRFEVQVLNEALVFSAGPGSAAASLRRFKNLGNAPVEVVPGPNLELKVHLKAIDAAVAANAVGLGHRPELLMVEAMRLKLRPLIEVIDEASLVARPTPDRSRLSLRLGLGRPK
jgi:hypothetical protein